MQTGRCGRCKRQSNLLWKYNGRSLSCRPCNTERLRAYRQTLVGKLNTRKASAKADKNNPLKRNARVKLLYHVKRGHINRPSHCSQCLMSCIPEGHHTDYTKPLDVVWLCRTCHVNSEDTIKIGAIIDM